MLIIIVVIILAVKEVRIVAIWENSVEAEL